MMALKENLNATACVAEVVNFFELHKGFDKTYRGLKESESVRSKHKQQNYCGNKSTRLKAAAPKQKYICYSLNMHKGTGHRDKLKTNSTCPLSLPQLLHNVW